MPPGISTVSPILYLAMLHLTVVDLFGWHYTQHPGFGLLPTQKRLNGGKPDANCQEQPSKPVIVYDKGNECQNDGDTCRAYAFYYHVQHVGILHQRLKWALSPPVGHSLLLQGPMGG